MTDAAMTTATEPDGAPRVAALDILRGIAILGILFMNINDMGGSLWASFDDPRHLGWTGADQVAWWLREVVATGTARCLLEMLFGVGMVILTDRAAAGLERAAAVPGGPIQRVSGWLFGDVAVLRGYARRNIVLFLFGLVHLFILMWPGDILHTYGIAALIAVLFRRLGPKMLLALGLVMAVLQLGGGLYGMHGAQNDRVERAQLAAKREAGKTLTAAEAKTLKTLEASRVRRETRHAETSKRIAIEDHARLAATGTFASWTGNAWRTILWMWGRADSVGEGQFLEWMFVWEALSTMLIGAALFRWGVIQGDRSPRFYRAMLVIGYGLGMGCRAFEAQVVMRFDDYPYMIYATQEASRLLTTLGHVSAVYLLLRTARGARLLRPFVAAGRTALTIYICQTIICLWILYPPFALGLYGKQGWMALMLTAVAIDAGLLWAANVYLRHFAIAPVEWAWRSIIAGTRLPIRRGTRADRPQGEPLPA